jgi:Tfp pilus assembly protein PilO
MITMTSDFFYIITIAITISYIFLLCYHFWLSSLGRKIRNLDARVRDLEREISHKPVKVGVLEEIYKYLKEENHD